MTSRRFTIVLLLSTPLFCKCPVAAQTTTGRENTPEATRTSAKNAKVAFVNEGTKRLLLLVGAWRFKEQHFDEAGDVIAEVRGTEEVSWQLDKHAVRRVYTRPADGSVYRAECLLTFNSVKNRYEGVWLDNVSVTGPRPFNGTWDDQTKTMSFVLTAMDADGATQQYRIVERFFGDSHRIATTYRLRDKEVIKVLEVSYRRAVPCPDSMEIQVILDDE